MLNRFLLRRYKRCHPHTSKNIVKRAIIDKIRYHKSHFKNVHLVKVEKKHEYKSYEGKQAEKNVKISSPCINTELQQKDELIP